MHLLSLMVLCILLVSHPSSAVPPAVPCVRVNSRPESWVVRRVDALVVAARAAYKNDDAQQAYDRVVKGIGDTIRQCKLSEDPGFVSRHREFVEYIEAAYLAQLPDHELGFVVPDRQYFEETRRYVQIPEFLLTQDFLRSVSRDETLNRAKSLLRDLNSKRGPGDQLIFFSYQSRHLGTPDNGDSYQRLLIVVPGNADKDVPEKWVQFGVTDRGVRKRTRNISIVSAMLGPRGTSDIYFKDFYRTYRRDGSISVTGRWELGGGSDNCVHCHKSGILPIFPEAGSVRVSEEQAVLAVNQRFLTYGSPRFGHYLDTNKFGPGLGAASGKSRTLRFGTGFDGSVAGRAMICSACHRPEQLGALNWPMDSVVISSFIKGGRMPPGHKLNASERNELYGRLIQEYFAVDDANPGILKSWLLGVQRSAEGSE